MSLSENIVRLRGRANLSQEALADLLDVSRQSISKWETGASVPELEKLVKLSEVFGVTLDELIKDAGAIDKPPSSPQEAVGARQPAASPGENRTAGLIYLILGVVILMAFAMIGGPVLGLVFSAPFFLCVALCLLIHRRRVGLWCAWGLYFLIDLYLRYATGLSWAVILQTFDWTAQMNYMRLFVAWMQFLAAAALVALTVWSCRKEPVILSRKGKKLYALGWVILLVLRPMLSRLISRLIWQLNGGQWLGRGLNLLYVLLMTLLSECGWLLLAALLTVTVWARRGMK